MIELQESTLDVLAALPGRATRAIIDLEALAGNVAALRRLLAPTTHLMTVVKSDGYGHGVVMVSRCALASGASMLGVATVGEAAELRQHQITAPILLLGPCDPTEVERALALDIELTVAGSELLDAVAAAAERLGKIARVHLKIDTGMHRYGVTPRDALAVIDRFEAIESVEIVAIATHYASADEPEHPANIQQAAIFEGVAAQIRVRLGRTIAIHSANSAATLRGMATGTDIARCGIATYGLAPGSDVPLPGDFRPVMSLISRLARVHCGEAGSGVSYGHTYIAESDERFGLVSIGYADGYLRALSNRSWVCIDGQRCPVRGNVCMDQMITGDVPETAQEGSLVGIAGPIGGGPGFDELAELAGTIPYEMLSGISRRVPRYYVADGKVVATLIEGTLETI
jgi:alanine racemase